MRTKPWLTVVPAALLALFTTSFATSAVPTAPVQAKQSAPLLPLTEADEMRGGVGCSCTFVVGEGSRARDLLMLAGNDLVSRTRAGVKVCKMGEPQVELIASTGGTARCGTRRITIRTRNTEQGNNDDSGADATVTIRDGKQTRTLKGAWACAC